MAIRPVFSPCETGDQLVKVTSLELRWHSGFALSQHKKNVQALHQAAEGAGIIPVLEVSTRSESELGNQLSAFNLQVHSSPGVSIPLESAFQGSKVFERGGPFTELYGQPAANSKRDARLHQSGALIGFCFEGQQWVLEPKTAFYDWLYIHAVYDSTTLRVALLDYCGFTDIAFNPSRSVNCQARSCALYVALVRRGLLVQVLKNRDAFIAMLEKDAHHHSLAKERQGVLALN